MNPHIAEMQRVLAAVMGIAEEDISIKATTTEKLGFTGRGEGIAAQAAVSGGVVDSGAPRQTQGLLRRKGPTGRPRLGC